MIHNKMTEQLLRILTGREQTSWLFTSAPGKLNQGLPGSNSTSGQTGLEPGISGSQGKRPNHWPTMPLSNKNKMQMPVQVNSVPARVRHCVNPTKDGEMTSLFPGLKNVSDTSTTIIFR